MLALAPRIPLGSLDEQDASLAGALARAPTGAWPARFGIAPA
jgi:hypothetical protein